MFPACAIYAIYPIYISNISDRSNISNRIDPIWRNSNSWTTIISQVISICCRGLFFLTRKTRAGAFVNCFTGLPMDQTSTSGVCFLKLFATHPDWNVLELHYNEPVTCFMSMHLYNWFGDPGMQRSALWMWWKLCIVACNTTSRQSGGTQGEVRARRLASKRLRTKTGLEPRHAWGVQL